MFEALGAYIKNIALIMLIMIFTEQLLPDAKIKKYVSVIAGIVMMFAVVGGIKDFFIRAGQEEVLSVFNYTDDTFEYNKYMEANNNTTDDFDIHVERVRLFNEDTKGEVVE